MKYKLINIVFLLFIFISQVFASPARKEMMMLTQPDGSSFMSYLQGDEFTKIRKTAEGHAIIQGKDGWWYYAIFNQDGLRRSSGYRVGGETPAGILGRSMSVPYGILSERAKSRREETARFAGNEAAAIRRMTSPATKSDPQVKHGLVILAQYKDISFKHTREDFVRLLTEDGYSLNGATGCAVEYFNAQFGGRMQFSFDVSSIVTLPNNRTYYGSNGSDGTDKAPAEMVRDACMLADDEIDFSIYDDDGDGTVDNVFVFFAGSDEAEGAAEECIWSHAWYVFSGAGITLELDGSKIDRYACTSEISRRYTTNGKYNEFLSGIGTFCHEYSHTFGLPDFYDTDYDEAGGWAAGLWGCTSLMDSGNENNNGNTPPNYNAIEREILGLGESVLIEEDGQYSLSPVNQSNEFFRMGTDKEDEYFIFECRVESGWDSYIGGSGMLVYHIDRTQEQIRRWNVTNEVNADASHQCADLIEADSRKDSFADKKEYTGLFGNVKGVFFPYGDITSLGPDSSPGLTYWSGDCGKQYLTGIKKIGNVVIFNLIGSSEESTPPTVRNMKHDSFCDGAVISFESSRPFDSEAKVIYGRATAAEADTLMLKPYETGKYALVIDGLEPARTYSVTAGFSIGEAEGETSTISFMTKKKPVVDWPYIYMGTEAGADGRFKVGSRIPLRAYNVSDAASVHWTFEGKGISIAEDGYFTITSNGVLKAHVTWDDGSTDVLMKEIIIAE